MSEKQPYYNISFKYWAYVYWYDVISIINPFKQPKHTSELKLSNFKNFVSCKNSVCLSKETKCTPCTRQHWLSYVANYYWPSYVPGYRTNTSYWILFLVWLLLYYLLLVFLPK